MCSPDKYITLTRNINTETENELYHYAGYYIYSEQHDDNLITYVRTDHRPYGYHISQRIIHPGTMRIQDKPDMNTAIIFNIKEKTVTTHNAEIDFELLRLIQKRAEELGFDQHKNKNECLIRRLKKFAAGSLSEIQPEDIQQALNLAIELYDDAATK